MTAVSSAEDLPRGTVTRSGKYAVGNNGDYFAVTRRCRHLRGPLDEGVVAADGCLVCPWHGAKYDVGSGRMVRGPRGVYAKVPGLGAFFKALTGVVPLGRAKVEVRDGVVHVDD